MAENRCKGKCECGERSGSGERESLISNTVSKRGTFLSCVHVRAQRAKLLGIRRNMVLFFGPKPFQSESNNNYSLPLRTEIELLYKSLWDECFFCCC